MCEFVCIRLLKEVDKGSYKKLKSPKLDRIIDGSNFEVLDSGSINC